MDVRIARIIVQLLVLVEMMVKALVTAIVEFVGHRISAKNIVIYFLIFNSIKINHFYILACSSECEALNRTCSETEHCCPEQCLGGCYADSKTQSSQICFLCKNFVYKNRCFDVCPNNSYAVSFFLNF